MKLRRSPVLKLSSLSKRELILVALFLFAALLASYYKYIFEPQWNNIKKLKSELQSQQQVLSQRKAQGWDDIQSLKEQSDELREKIKKTYVKVTNIKDEPGLLVDFYKLSVTNNLTADTIKFSELKEADGKGYSTFNVTLDFIGLNRDIYNFIEALENYTRLNRVSDIKFQPLSPNVSQCSLAVEFYVLHEIKPDPLVYPFMAGEYRRDQPYKIFDLYYKLKDINRLLFPAPPGSSPTVEPPPKEEAPPAPKAGAPGAVNTAGTPPQAKNSIDGSRAAGEVNSHTMVVSKDGIIWYPSASSSAKGKVVPPEKER
ncbi:MAG: type 4a pilus biogenesis protein PilO [Bacillota bacterium]